MGEGGFRGLVVGPAVAAALVLGLVLLFAPPIQSSPPAASTSSLGLLIVPDGPQHMPTYVQSHAMVHHGVIALSLVNKDVNSHSFNIPGLGINVVVAPMSSVSTSIDIPNPGIYHWYCLDPCPGMAPGMGGAGMTGELVVV